MNIEDFRFVGRLPLFRGIPADDFAGFCRHAVVRHHAKRERVFLDGDVARHFYVVLSGWVATSRTSADGDETMFTVVERGKCLQLFPALLGKPYTAGGSVVSKEADVIAFDGARLRALLARNPALTEEVITYSFDEFREIESDLEAAKTRTATERVLDFILDQCPTTVGPATVQLPYEKTVLSGKLGMQPESLSRVLKKLRRAGVHVERDCVHVADVARLRTMALPCAV